MKQLVPNTIIPESLYVNRVADKQLREIIHDMGRPGYILVARQMGKTNLLINAKRKLESSEDIFAYIDLSNRYDTDRECFRSIVDTILETKFDLLEHIAEEIYSDRESKTVSAHREHSREIRKILKAIKGKLIINLDEIDSLTTADYSDKIFAHVRSIYFERINFKEYESLSYIISGVAEPSEIIKDKSISPFNIGQKILLGDFSYSEFQNFLCKAELNWSESIQKRIFHWCNGNPRLSWEICSSLEDISISGIEISESHVDEIVNDLYLTNFDRPPVDHIRALVESDKELREAVIAINYKKSDILSDSVKSRLYLSGILGSDYEYGNVRIKNKIIEASLGENWLSELEKTDNLSINRAEDLFGKREYSDALEIFLQLSKQKDLSKLDQMSIKYKLGLCYFHTGNYQKVIESYENSIFDKTGYRDVHMDQIYTLGMSHYQLDEDEDALEQFDIIINDGDNPFYHEALINKAAILVRSGSEEKTIEAIKLNQVIIDLHEKGVNIKSHALSGAYYNIAALNEVIDPRISVENFLKSAQFADDKVKVKPLISAIALQPEIIDENLKEIKKSLASKQIYLDTEGLKTGMELTSSDIALLIEALYEQNRIFEIDCILDLVKEDCLYDKTSFSSALLEMAISKLSAANNSEAIYLLEKAINSPKEYSTPESIFTCNKYLTFIDKSNTNSQESYFKGFQNYVQVSDFIDHNIFSEIISNLITQNEYQKALSYCDFIINNEGHASKSNRAKFLTILYLKMKATHSENDLLEQAKIVKEVAEHVEETKSYPPGINSETVGFIKHQAINTLLQQPIPQFIRPEKKYGRNEKVKVEYEDGRQEYKKYKLVSEWVKKGRCKIID